MNYLIIILFTVIFSGCEANGLSNAAGGASVENSSSRSNSSSSTAVVPTTYTYTFELTGNGIMFTSTINGYAERNYGGAVTNQGDAGFTLGAATKTYTVTSAGSVSATFTYNSGPGLLSITTKKDGSVIRSDNLIISSAQAIIIDPN